MHSLNLFGSFTSFVIKTFYYAKEFCRKYIYVVDLNYIETVLIVNTGCFLFFRDSVQQD